MSRDRTALPRRNWAAAEARLEHTRAARVLTYGLASPGKVRSKTATAWAAARPDCHTPSLGWTSSSSRHVGVDPAMGPEGPNKETKCPNSHSRS